MRFVYVGQFCDHCTESCWCRAFAALGHETVQITQAYAHANPDHVERQILRARPAVVFYSRTHNHTALGPDWTARWRRFEDAGIKTCGLHLDLFWGLEAEREGWITGEPRDAFFTMGLVATPDPGDRNVPLPDDAPTGDFTMTITRNLWAAHGVNHLWSPPAIDRQYAYRGTPQDKYRTRFAFVGSRGYHDAYPERGQLIDACEQRWGDEFRWWGGGSPNGVVRGHELADLYASVDVVIGDSCFALNPEKRVPFYVSDRIFETLGRGGILVHPMTEGLMDYGIYTQRTSVATVEGLLDYAQERADALDPATAEVLRIGAHRTTLERDLYEHRARAVLDALGIGQEPT